MRRSGPSSAPGGIRTFAEHFPNGCGTSCKTCVEWRRHGQESVRIKRFIMLAMELRRRLRALAGPAELRIGIFDAFDLVPGRGH